MPVTGDGKELMLEAGPENRYRVSGLPGLNFIYLVATVWQHLKRGTTYTTLFTAEVQGELKDGDCVVVYADHKTLGKYWVCKFEKFHDGRFRRQDG